MMLINGILKQLGRINTEYFKIRLKYHQRNYYSSIDPTELIYVNPNCIKYKITDSSVFQENSSFPGLPISGNWDRSIECIEKHPYYSPFFEHFVEGKPWEKTTYYKKKVKRIENNQTKKSDWHPYNSIKKVKKDLIEIDKLYEKIKKEGYHTQRELQNKQNVPMGNPKSHRIPELNEIKVAISRDGKILFVDGGHRFFISKILQLDEIPVCIVTRHAEWQAFRDDIYTCILDHGFSEDSLSHPDI